MKIGYIRVSTKEQELGLQEDAMRDAGIEKKNVYCEKASSVKVDRPELAKALAYLREGDTLVVWRLDRLGRSLKDLTTIINDLQERGIHFQSLTESIDTSTAAGKLIFHVFAALAQFERELIIERTNAGLVAARARGKKGGNRPFVLDAEKLAMAKELYDSKKHTVQEIMKTVGIKNRKTFYNHVVNA